MNKQRLVIGLSGSSGAILGIRLLEYLRSTPIETHLIITPSAHLTIEQETAWKVDDVLALASVHYNPRDLSAPIASGSFNTIGMIVIPCSVKSLSAIANAYAADLLTRAADVTLKEGRPLLLVLREAPLHAGHIRLMSLAARSGAVIFPPVPAFYARPQSVDEVVDNIVGRVLSRMGIENNLYLRWQGIKKGALAPAAENIHRAGGLPEQPAGEAELWDLPAMTLATAGPEGSPHAAAVYFVADEDHRNLYFFSTLDSQHSQDLAANPRASATIFPAVDSWREIRGLQLRGEARPVPLGEPWEQAWARYLEKFPFAADLKDVVAYNTLYTFRPDWVRWIDNRLGFGHKQERTQA